MAQRREVIESLSVFAGKLLSVFVETIRMPDGSTSVRELVRHPGASAVVGIDGDRVVLVKQNRHSVGRDLLEIPAGKLDQKDEDPKSCAIRELFEETGYEARRIEPLISYFPSPGFCDERIHIFLATDLASAGAEPTSDEGEPISVHWMSLPDALQAVGEGSIEDSKTIIGLLIAAQRLGLTHPA